MVWQQVSLLNSGNNNTELLLRITLIIIRVSRLGQKAVLPIILSSEFDLKLAFFGAVIPASVAIALDQLVLKPRRKRFIKQ